MNDERECGVHRSSFIVHRFHEIVHQQKRSARNLLLACIDLLPQRRVPRDLDRLAQREVLVVRDQHGHLAAVAREDRALAGDFAVADQLARIAGEIEDLDAALHHSFTMRSGLAGSSLSPPRYSRNSLPSAGWRSAKSTV